MTDPNPSNNSASATATVTGVPPATGTVNADLRVTLGTPQHIPVAANGFATVNYSVVLRNVGPGPAHGALVTVPAVAGVTKTAVACRSDKDASVCPTTATAALLEAGLAIPWLPANSEVTITVTSTAAPTVNVIPVSASATTPAGVTDGASQNNSASANVTVDR
jgi:hypothetical protein